MWYEINISLNGKHFFATDKRSITNDNELKKVYDVLIKKFPKSENYELLITKNECVGKIIDMDKQ